MPIANTNIAPPPYHLLGTEPLRATIEYARSRFRRTPRAAKGDGHGVVIFPGLATNERFVEPLRAHCERLGYDARDWGRGFNVGPRRDVGAFLRELASAVHALALNSRLGRVSLVGWSLGGLYAREIAKRVPHRVRRVITIGTPVNRLSGISHVEWLFRALNPATNRARKSVERQMRAPPPVPTTAIYSRLDGVVAWQACVNDPATGVENLEVDASHLGLVWHPDVLDIVGDRLSREARGGGSPS